MSVRNLISLLAIILSTACDQKNEKASSNTSGDPAASFEKASTPAVKIKHAKKFEVDTYKGYTVVSVLSPWQGAQQNYSYILVPRGKEMPPIDILPKSENNFTQIVQVPIERLVCTSTTHIPLLDLLDETKTLVGFPGTDHISSPQTRTLIEAGKVVDLGNESSLNIEKLVELQPQALMDYAMQGENAYIRKARKAGISVLFNADYLEETPLGRAEWIKFAGLFFNKVSTADSIFNSIEARYNSLKQVAAGTEKRPKVFSGIMYGDTWFLPGGANAGAQFIKDAQGHYLWEGTEEDGSLKLSFETVYATAHDADFWIGVADFQSLEGLKNSDARYADFQAFRKRSVYSYNAKMGDKGGLTYFELGYIRPDLILADYIKILHPQLLPDYELYFHRKLD